MIAHKSKDSFGRNLMVILPVVVLIIVAACYHLTTSGLSLHDILATAKAEMSEMMRKPAATSLDDSIAGTPVLSDADIVIKGPS